MKKKDTNKLVQNLKSAFINDVDVAIEKAVRINLKRINKNNIKQVHAKMLKIAGINDEADSQYYSLNAFIALLNNIKADKAKRAAAAKKGAATTEAEEADNQY